MVGVRRVLQILRGRGEETDARLRRSEARREVQRPRGLGGTLQRRAMCDVVRMEFVGGMLGDVRIGGQGEVGECSAPMRDGEEQCEGAAVQKMACLNHPCTRKLCFRLAFITYLVSILSRMGSVGTVLGDVRTRNSI